MTKREASALMGCLLTGVKRSGGRTALAGADNVPNRRKGSAGQCRSSILQRAELALPGKRMGHNGREIVELRLPPEQFLGAVGLRHDLCWVARAGLGARDPQNDAGLA